MQDEPKRFGVNMLDVQEINRALTLKVLHEKGECSRTEIAKATGLRQTTITNIVNDLIGCGIVVETSLLRGERGRRSIGLRLNQSGYRIIGMRLVRHQIRAGLFDLTSTQHEYLEERISAEEGVAAAIGRMKHMIWQLMDAAGDAKILGIGIGVPGPYLRADERIAFMADFPGWESFSIKEELSRTFGLSVYIEQDFHAGALAEWWFGGQRGDAHTLLAVRMEQGLGAGLIQDGVLYYGSQGIAGNIGHLTIDYQGLPCECGSRGCLRNYCTGKALVKEVKAALEREDTKTTLRGLQPLAVRDILEAAVSGDAFAAEAVRRCARFLGYGLISVVYAYNPDLIILSEEFAPAGGLFLKEVRAVFAERLQPAISGHIRIAFTRLPRDPVIMGTVAAIINWVMKNPSQYLDLV